MRLAMNFRREIAELAAGRGGRQLVQRARLEAAARRCSRRPSACRRRSARSTSTSSARSCATRPSALFGTDKLTAFQDPAAVEKLINRFLARAQIEEGAGATGPAAAALTLLQG